jgi:hypothetical protein
MRVRLVHNRTPAGPVPPLDGRLEMPRFPGRALLLPIQMQQERTRLGIGQILEF